MRSNVPQVGKIVNKTEARLKRSGTSRNIHHAADSLHDSLDATMEIERLIAEHGEGVVETLLLAMATRQEQAGVREIVQRITNEGRG